MASRAPLSGENGSEQACSLCGQLSPALGAEVNRNARRNREGGGHHGTRLCPRCGAILPKSIEARLRKLSQLARFGLGADAKPLLGPSYCDRSRGDPEEE